MNSSVGQPEANGQNHGAVVVLDACQHGTKERVWEIVSQRLVNDGGNVVDTNFGTE